MTFHKTAWRISFGFFSFMSFLYNFFLWKGVICSPSLWLLCLFFLEVFFPSCVVLSFGCRSPSFTLRHVEPLCKIRLRKSLRISYSERHPNFEQFWCERRKIFWTEKVSVYFTWFIFIIWKIHCLLCEVRVRDFALHRSNVIIQFLRFSSAGDAT